MAITTEDALERLGPIADVLSDAQPPDRPAGGRFDRPRGARRPASAPPRPGIRPAADRTGRRCSRAMRADDPGRRRASEEHGGLGWARDGPHAQVVLSAARGRPGQPC